MIVTIYGSTMDPSWVMFFPQVGVADGFPQRRPRPGRLGRRAVPAACAAEPASAAAGRGAPGVSARAAGDAGDLAVGVGGWNSSKDGGHTWWLIPLSKWVITPVINGISRVNPPTY